jgi:hypothetical protein
MNKNSKIVANVKVGKPDVTSDRPSHIKGVREGNNPGGAPQAGIIPYQEGIHNQARGTASRSTGINPHDMNPIDPRMPNISPA